VDLYNFAYWWECHEQFEALWHAAGRNSEPGRYFQGLIQVAAAHLKRFAELHDAADKLWRGGLERLGSVPSRYMGGDVVLFIKDVRAYFELAQPCPPLIQPVLGQGIGGALTP
jgi:predicted metal-dependent hydrolase